MKKIIFALIALFRFAITSFAQQSTKKKTEKETKEVKTTTKTVLKKDGTVDKRYKVAKKIRSRFEKKTELQIKDIQRKSNIFLNN